MLQLSGAKEFDCSGTQAQSENKFVEFDSLNSARSCRVKDDPWQKKGGTMWNPKTFEKMSQGDWSADKKEWCCTEHDACSQICHTWFAVIMQVRFSLRLKYGSRRLEAGFQNKYFQVLPSSEFDGVGRQTFLETTLRFLCAQDKGCEADEPYDCRAGVLTSGLTTKQTWD